MGHSEHQGNDARARAMHVEIVRVTQKRDRTCPTQGTFWCSWNITLSCKTLGKTLVSHKGEVMLQTTPEIKMKALTGTRLICICWVLVEDGKDELNS